jgi:glycosyltransferase involved in cell wall biosynthesis
MARIGIVIYSLAGAGAERVAVNLAHEFVALGHRVDFILVQREGELLSAVPEHTGVFHADVPSAAGWKNAIRSYARRERPEALLAMMEGAGVLCVQATMGFAERVPVYVVSHIQFSHHCRMAARWKERLLVPLAVRWYLRRASGVIGVSEGVSRDIRQFARLDEKNVHTIYNPVLTDELHRLRQEVVSDPWLSPERDWMTVVTVGRLTAQKDHETLLRAIAEINSVRPVRLLVFGQGERREILGRAAVALGIADIVRFAGFDPNPHRCIAAADVFALSSAWEGFGNVLVEALAAGVPVVSTDCPSGPREVLEHGRFGTLVPVGNSAALASALLRAGQQQVDQNELAAHLRKFESRPVASQYLDVMGLAHV